MDYEVKHMGQHRGNARLWFETMKLETVGLTKGTRFTLRRFKAGGFEITPHPDGERIVSGKEKGGKTVPIIDINSNEALGDLADQPACKVVYDMDKKMLTVTKLSSQELKEARTKGLVRSLAAKCLAVAALCFGGGIMDHAAHAGLADAGLRSELVAAVEIDANLLEHARQHNPVVTANTRLYATPLQELVQDDGAMSELPQVDILVTGIPCSGASLAGRAKNGAGKAEDHPEVGHLVVPYLMLVQRLQPAVAVVECVPRYGASASAQLMRLMFRDMGYTTQELTLDAWDFGSLESRDRWFFVAATHGVNLDLSNLAPAVKLRPKLGSVLDAQVDESMWNTMQGLRDKAVRDLEKGSNFKLQILDESSTKVGTIGKHYYKHRSTEPKVQHPTRPDHLRVFTAAEHARIKGVPLSMLGTLSHTQAHMMLGQSVDVQPVQALFKRIGSELLRWDGLSASVAPHWAGRAVA